MTEANTRMKNWLKDNGIIAMPKYIDSGSMRGCWRIYGLGAWWGNEELQKKFRDLGFVDFDGDPLDNFSGNGGMFSIFPNLTDKKKEMELLHGIEG
jgi:hypothetical protein